MRHADQAGRQRRRLAISSFVVALVLFILANALVGPLGKASTTCIDPLRFQDSPAAFKDGRPGSWWITRSYLQEVSAPEVVLFGSSQLGGVNAADAKLLSRKLDWVLDHRCQIMQQALAQRIGSPVSVFVCGLPGAMISDHYLISRSLFPFKKPSLVILTVAPRDFIDNFLPEISSTEPYRFFSRYLQSDEVVKKLMLPSWNDQLQNAFTSTFPLKNISSLFAWRTALDGLLGVVHLKLGGVAANQSLPNQTGWLFSLNSNDCVRPGQCVVLPNMPTDFIDNSTEYAKRYRNCNPPVYRQEMQYLTEYLKYCREQKIRVLLVDMPLTELNRKLLPAVFWASYKSGINTACKQYGASYLDLSTDSDFRINDFVDTVHLNATGGTKLVNKVADAVIVDKELIASIVARRAAAR
jgi:hypothetical protein